jgi:hypothetical protein
MAHPKSNGHVERENTEILRGLKTHTYDCLKSMVQMSQQVSMRVARKSDHTQPSYWGDPILPGLWGQRLPSPRNP